MKQANYREIEQLLADRAPFKGNSLSAYTDNFGNYQVYSYTTLIANTKADGSTWVDPRKYSVTTSRAQNLIKKAWSI